MALPACVSSGPVAARHGTEAAAEALGGQGFGAWPSVNRHDGDSPPKAVAVARRGCESGHMAKGAGFTYSFSLFT